MSNIVFQKKNEICHHNLNSLKLLADLGATDKLFERYFCGSFKGLGESFIALKSDHFTFDRNKKLGAISWVATKEAENAAFILLKMYRIIAPDNRDFNRKATKEELAGITLSYNIKFSDTNPIDVNKVWSLLMAMSNIEANKGLAIFHCSCNRPYITRSSSAAATCQWCRKKIKKPSNKRPSTRMSFSVDVASLLIEVPSTNKKPTAFFNSPD